MIDDDRSGVELREALFAWDLRSSMPEAQVRPTPPVARLPSTHGDQE